MKEFPKISVVTPNYNQAPFLELTIKSVLDQGYPNLEYIIIDGGSTDRSVEIIKKYEEKLTYWISEKDHGLYDALNKGFAKSTGEIMMYINSDDLLLPGSLSLVGKILTSYPEIKWMTGYFTLLNEEGEITQITRTKHWSIIDYVNLKYQFIQQEATVWRRSTWITAGNSFNTKYKYAGDLDLWSRFFLQADPVIADFQIGAFRTRKDQLSQAKNKEYHLEALQILRDLNARVDSRIVRQALLFKRLVSFKYLLMKTVILYHKLLVHGIDRMLLKIKGKGSRVSYINGSWVLKNEKDKVLYRLW